MNAKATAPRLTPQERAALAPLRRRYQVTRGLLTPQELARLEFVRWLVASGRLSH